MWLGTLPALAGTHYPRARFLLWVSNEQEELMTQFRQAAIYAVSAIALIAGLSSATAQTTVITREPVQSQTVVTTTQPLQLTPTQRQTVYRTIVRERVAPAQPTVTYRVGMRVPETAQLYSVPDTVAVEVPAVRSYKYMMVNDRVVLVDPATGEVVGELAD
jgi:hypothetical protein